MIFFCFKGAKSGEFDVLQGKRQGRILPAFMYKVGVNELTKIMPNRRQNFRPYRKSEAIRSPAFADDKTVLVLFLSFLQNLMEKVFCYSRRWGSYCSETKSSAITFGEYVNTIAKY